MSENKFLTLKCFIAPSIATFFKPHSVQCGALLIVSQTDILGKETSGPYRFNTNLQSTGLTNILHTNNPTVLYEGKN